MSVYQPLCGDTAVHRRHLHWDGPERTAAFDCGGYSAEQRDVAELVRLLEALQTDQMVLEVGPGAMSALTASLLPDFDDLLTDRRTRTIELIPVEVRLVRTLGANGWRIVIKSGVIGDGVG